MKVVSVVASSLACILVIVDASGSYCTYDAAREQKCQLSGNCGCDDAMMSTMPVCMNITHQLDDQNISTTITRQFSKSECGSIDGCEWRTTGEQGCHYSNDACFWRNVFNYACSGFTDESGCTNPEHTAAHNTHITEMEDQCQSPPVDGACPDGRLKCWVWAKGDGVHVRAEEATCCATATNCVSYSATVSFDNQEVAQDFGECTHEATCDAVKESKIGENTESSSDVQVKDWKCDLCSTDGCNKGSLAKPSILAVVAGAILSWWTAL